MEREDLLRANAGGIVEIHHDHGELVCEGETLYRITGPFKSDATVVEVPFPGLLVGVLGNPVVYPGTPLCHLVKVDETRRRIIDGADGRQ